MSIRIIAKEYLSLSSLNNYFESKTENAILNEHVRYCIKFTKLS